MHPLICRRRMGVHLEEDRSSQPLIWRRRCTLGGGGGGPSQEVHPWRRRRGKWGKAGAAVDNGLHPSLATNPIDGNASALLAALGRGSTCQLEKWCRV